MRAGPLCELHGEDGRVGTGGAYLIVRLSTPDLDCAVARRGVNESLSTPDDGLHAVRVALHTWHAAP